MGGSGEPPDPLDELSLVTTHATPLSKLLVASGDTSAAAAQAARLAATIQAQYPHLWPESVRALIVHSAEWTEQMRRDVERVAAGRRTEVLVRRNGWGVPSIERARWSASNALTLIAQDQFRPFAAPQGGRVPTKDMNVHALPWPREALQDLEDTEVELRVTLSYFIEPSPGRRGWRYRHRYASYGLRFAVKNPLERVDAFRARLSRDAQDDDTSGGGGEQGWTLGRLRKRGSIHSDIWRGPAVELAERGMVGVFPVGGWWKERHHLGRWKRTVRYALIVSIRTPATEIDIYTPVELEVGVPIEIAT